MKLAVHTVPGEGTEDVAVVTSGRYAGWVYTGTDDGSILRVRPDGAQIERVATTRGRPLGIEVLPEGRLVVCDARRGLLRVDPADGAVEVLVGQVEGLPMRFCNNAAVASDGSVWFSDSSSRFGQDRWKDEMLRRTRTGRLLHWVEGGEVEVVLDGLDFANGVALAPDGTFLVVAETSGRRLLRVWLTGQQAWQREVFAGDLPGYPDNVSTGSDELIWVALASPTDRVVSALHATPSWFAGQVTRIPQRWQPAPRRTVRARAYDAVGRCVHDLDLPADGFHMVTGVREHDGVVWFGSLHEPAIASVRLAP
jgi:sugar lactone lactonase YvrE